MFVVADSSSWWLGDWLIYGQNHYPDRYKRAVAGTSLDYQTLRNYAWVARKFVVDRRRSKLSFQHHVDVAGLPEAEQEKWLTRAEQEGWTRNHMRKQIRASRGAEAAGTEVALVQLNVVPARQKRWQLAAESANMELLEWITLMLDKASEDSTDHLR
jgi:hypothetical protein